MDIRDPTPTPPLEGRGAPSGEEIQCQLLCCCLLGKYERLLGKYARYFSKRRAYFLKFSRESRSQWCVDDWFGMLYAQNHVGSNRKMQVAYTA